MYNYSKQIQLQNSHWSELELQDLVVSWGQLPLIIGGPHIYSLSSVLCIIHQQLRGTRNISRNTRRNMTSNISMWGGVPPHWVHLGRGRIGAAGRRDLFSTLQYSAMLWKSNSSLHCCTAMLFKSNSIFHLALCISNSISNSRLNAFDLILQINLPIPYTICVDTTV